MPTNNSQPKPIPSLYTLAYALFACVLASMALLGSTNAAAGEITSNSKHESAEQAANAVLDAFMLAFNNKDMKAWSETLNYPHVRFASGEVRVWQDVSEFSETPPFSALAKIGWNHSHWISRKVVMSSPAKVHIATVFQRFNSANQSIGTYESLYIVTRVNGRWGIQSRSSLAP